MAQDIFVSIFVSTDLGAFLHLVFRFETYIELVHDLRSAIHVYDIL